jgi:hypothetical protein
MMVVVVVVVMIVVMRMCRVMALAVFNRAA